MGRRRSLAFPGGAWTPAIDYERPPNQVLFEDQILESSIHGILKMHLISISQSESLLGHPHIHRYRLQRINGRGAGKARRLVIDGLPDCPDAEASVPAPASPTGNWGDRPSIL
jgi:hypothetical protein